MTAWSFLKYRHSLGPAQPVSLGQTDAEELGREMSELNHQITAMMVAELAIGGISPELASIIETRDRLRTRLSRLEGTQHG